MKPLAPFFARSLLVLFVLTSGLASRGAVFLEPRTGIGGSGGTTNITTTTNGVLNLATNNVPISGVGTQLNLVGGSYIRLTGTNATDKVSVGVALDLAALPGTGNYIALTAGGLPYRTNITTGGSTISNANTLYVAADGNNSTAVRGHLDLPYATPFAAKTAAVAGDTIVVFPGVYLSATNLLKGGVNWFVYTGAWLCHTNTTNDPGIGIWDDRWTGAVTCTVAGAFSSRYSTGFETTNALYAPAYGPTNYLGCIVITNNASQVNIKFDQIDYQSVKSSADAAAAVWLGGGSNCFISGNLIRDVSLTTNYFIGTDLDLGDPVLLESKAIGVYWTGGEHHIDIKRISCKFNSFYAGGADSKAGNCWLNSDFLFGQFYCAGSATQPNWRVWANVKELQCNRTNNNSAGAITFGFGGKLYYEGLKVSESGTITDPAGIAITQLTGSTNCESWFTIQKVSASGKWISCASGNMHAAIEHFEDLGAVDRGINVTGGKLILSGLDGTVTNTTGSAVYHSAGDLKTMSMVFAATNSSAATVLLATNGAVLHGGQVLSKLASFSVAGTAAVTANLEAGIILRTGMSNNVSGQVGPWVVDANAR